MWVSMRGRGTGGAPTLLRILPAGTHCVLTGRDRKDPSRLWQFGAASPLSPQAASCGGAFLQPPRAFKAFLHQSF